MKNLKISYVGIVPAILQCRTADFSILHLVSTIFNFSSIKSFLWRNCSKWTSSNIFSWTSLAPSSRAWRRRASRDALTKLFSSAANVELTWISSKRPFRATPKLPSSAYQRQKVCFYAVSELIWCAHKNFCKNVFPKKLFLFNNF